MWSFEKTRNIFTSKGRQEVGAAQHFTYNTLTLEIPHFKSIENKSNFGLKIDDCIRYGGLQCSKILQYITMK